MREIVVLSIIATGIVGTVLLSVWYWPILPDRVASHFDAAGNADRWSSRASLVVTHISLHLGFVGMFAVFLVLIKKLPASMINIPNREYWLSGSRGEQTLDAIRFQLLVVAAATSVFIFLLSWLVYQASLQDGKLSPLGFWGLMVCFVTFLIGFVFYCHRLFRLPENATED